MVNVVINDSGYTVKGHADYDKEGKDIVCSAISSLTQTIAITLNKECRASILITKNGIDVKLREYGDKEKLLLKTLYIGLNNIEKEYSECIQIKIKGKVCA